MHALINESIIKSTLASPGKRKKILVLYSEGGGGHKAAADAIVEHLRKTHDVTIVDVLSEVLPSIDHISTVFFGRFNGDDLYNSMLKRGYHRLVSLYATLGESYMLLNYNRIEKGAHKFLKSLDAHPDLVISVVPFFNGGIAKACLENDIPFLLIPTDLDVSTFLIGFNSVDIYNKDKFAFGVAYDDFELNVKARDKICLSDEQVHIIGFPIKPACLQNYSEEEINQFKEHFSLRLDTKVASLVLGAAGGNQLLSYALEIASMEDNLASYLELNVCCGRNKKAFKQVVKKLAEKGKALRSIGEHHKIFELPLGLIVHIRGFVHDFPQLMACSDLLISKTGSCSVNEAIYLKKRLLLDDTPHSSSRRLRWEGPNVPFVKKYGLGDAFCDIQELNAKIIALIEAPENRGLMLPDFGQNLKRLVDKMLKKPAHQPAMV